MECFGRQGCFQISIGGYKLAFVILDSLWFANVWEVSTFPIQKAMSLDTVIVLPSSYKLLWNQLLSYLEVCHVLFVTRYAVASFPVLLKTLETLAIIVWVLTDFFNLLYRWALFDKLARSHYRLLDLLLVMITADQIQAFENLTRLWKSFDESCEFMYRRSLKDFCIFLFQACRIGS